MNVPDPLAHRGLGEAIFAPEGPRVGAAGPPVDLPAFYWSVLYGAAKRNS
jgi:hypothetical protein